MTFRVLDALPILVRAYGETINKVSSGRRKGLENQKVMGFRTSRGRLVALHVENPNVVRVWFDSSHAVALHGATVKPEAPDNHDLTGELSIFRSGRAAYAEFETADAFRRFVAGY